MGPVTIYLINAIAGDRFVDQNTNTGWTVLSNHGGVITMVSDDGTKHQGTPPADMTVDLTNRDDGLDMRSAIGNIQAAGLNPRVVSVE